MNLVSQYSFGFYILCFLLGLVYAFLLYRRDSKLSEFSSALIVFLAIFRGITVSIIAIMLLSPLVKYLSRTVEKPIVIIAVDNSSSMKLRGLNSEVSYVQMERNLREQLSDQYQVSSYRFDENLQELGDDTLNFEGKLTNFENLFEGVNSRFVNRNLGGMLIISDGIYNQGSSPLYFREQIDFPVYTIAAGDTSRRIDAKVSGVRNNKLAFLGNQFPVEVDLKIEKAKGDEAEVKILHNGKVVFRDRMKANSDYFAQTFNTTLEANELGVQKYTVQIDSLPSEENTLNNQLAFYVDVLDGRQKIGLYGMAPHPDLAAFKRSIVSIENFSISDRLFENFDGEIKNMDLIILHHPINRGRVQIDTKLKKILESKVPLLLVGGGWEQVGLIFGIKSTSQNQDISNDAFAGLNKNFSLFTINEDLVKLLKDFPPLIVEASSSSGVEPNSILFYQKIGSVETNYPLLAFYEKDGRKVGRLFAEGIWKWGMTNYAIQENHQSFHNLMRKIIQYLALKTERSYFRVETKREYFENEEISFNAQLFNQSYELINEPEVSLTIEDENEKQFNFVFNQHKNAYRLVVQSLPIGNYSFEARAKMDNQSYTEKGSFVVKELQIEQRNQVADHNLLFQLSEKAGGEMLSPESASTILEKLNKREDINSISYVDEKLEEIINLKWIFFLVIGLLTVEWFLRKRNGAY